MWESACISITHEGGPEVRFVRRDPSGSEGQPEGSTSCAFVRFAQAFPLDQETLYTRLQYLRIYYWFRFSLTCYSFQRIGGQSLTLLSLLLAWVNSGGRGNTSLYPLNYVQKLADIIKSLF